MKKSNIIITGQRKVGKSYLINQLIENLNLRTSGFQTLPYQIDGEDRGYYFHSLIPLLTYYNNLPINVRHLDKGCIPITHTYRTLGCECLKKSILIQSDCIIMDELGRFEKEEETFLSYVQEAFDSEKFVLAVLKKEEIPYICQLKDRDDVYVFDLDNLEWKKAFTEIQNLVTSFIG